MMFLLFSVTLFSRVGDVNLAGGLRFERRYGIKPSDGKD
jgi:hypothetical protein